MIKQNDKRCLPIIQKIGCFVRSCGAIAEIKMMQKLTAEQINELWNWSIKSGNVKNNCVKHSAPIATKAIQMLGGNGKFIEVATFRNGKLNFYASVPEHLKDLKKSFIQKIKTDGTEGTHFRVVSADGSVLFDPYAPEVFPIAIFYSIVYVYIEG